MSNFIFLLGGTMKYQLVLFIFLLLLSLLNISCPFSLLTRDEYGQEFGNPPQINVRQGTTDYPDGGSTPYDFGSTDYTKYVTFTIENLSEDSQLTLTGSPRVKVDGDSTLTIDQQPGISVLDPGSTVDFIIKFSSDDSDTFKNADIIIENNDPDKGEYTFSVTGYAEMV
jgi:hypothetical protein